MKILKRVSAAALTVLIIFSLIATVVSAAGQPSSYSVSKNSGERDVVCTTLSGTNASSYYTGSNTYSNLSSLSSSALLSSLRTLMKSTHKEETSYNECKSYASSTDCQNEDGTVILLYTSYAARSSDFSGSSPGWNREHVWPQSLGGFKTSRAGSDLHHIRPDDVKTNGTRGNKKYGNVSGGSQAYADALVGTGVSGGTYNSSYFEPHDNVKGDVARICLYVYARWGGEYSDCSKITNVFQSVDVLLEWCELDPVDTWEMGRNQVVEEIQGNRNVFIDYPEFAWLLFGKEIPNDMVTPSGMAMNSSSTPPPVCTHTSTELRGATSADCDTKGYTGDVYCKDCGEKLSTGTDIPKTNSHTFGEWITDTANNERYRTCSTCGERQSTPLNLAECLHPLKETLDAVDADCMRGGYTGDVYCKLCYELISKGEPISPNDNHKFGEWETDVAAGEKTRVCSTCGKKETASITPGGCQHTELKTVGAVAAGDCLSPGYTGDKRCKSCDALIEKGSVIEGAHEWIQVSKDSETCVICSEARSVTPTPTPDNNTATPKNNNKTTTIILISVPASAVVISIPVAAFILRKRKL